MNVALIPARGGSKRIPGKNIKLFAGRPIISYAIRAALESALFDRVVVSTDSEEIAEVGRKFGAEVPFMRPDEIADDHSGTDEVILHALDSMGREGEKPRYLCCIYATAVFVRLEDLRRGYDVLVGEGATTSFCVSEFPAPIFRALRLNDDNRLEMFWPEHRTSRSQDLPTAYHDVGQFYWVDVPAYERNPALFSDNSAPIILPRGQAVDIDTPEEWEIAETMFAARNR